MTKQITITVRDYIMDDIIGEAKNKSARIEELIMKGYLAELKKKEVNNAVMGIMSPNLIYNIKDCVVGCLA